MYLVIEGPNGAGKTSISDELIRRLESMGYNAVYVREPGGTEIGDHLRDILKGKDFDLCPTTEFFLFMAGRAQIFEDIVKNKSKDTILVSDRSIASTLVFQFLMNNHEYMLPVVNRLFEGMPGLIAPDVTCFINTSQDKIENRKEGKVPEVDRFEEKTFCMTEIEGYKRLYDMGCTGAFKSMLGDIAEVDNNGEMTTTVEAIIDLIHKYR